MLNPLTGKDEPVASVLRSIAGQENCDGMPYDQMQEAADYIAKLEDWLKSVHNMTIMDTDAYGKIHMIHEICDRTLEHKQ